MTHESLLLLFQNQPELAATLLAEALHVPVPHHTEASVESASFTQVVPAEYRADLVITLREAGVPVLGVVVEAQLRVDRDKHYAWPLYAVDLRARLRCPACVLVVTPSAAVAAWAAEVQQLGPGSVFSPSVLGPDAVPVVVDPAVAAREPELAVLSVLAHGQGRADVAVRVAVAAMAGVERTAQVDESRSNLYFDLVESALGGAARAAFEEIMSTTGGYVFKGPTALRAIAEGREKGREEGRTEGFRAALLGILSARGMTPSAAQASRIHACTDSAVLERWAARALGAASVAEVLEP